MTDLLLMFIIHNRDSSISDCDLDEIVDRVSEVIGVDSNAIETDWEFTEGDE